MTLLHSSLRSRKLVCFEIETREFLHIGDTRGLDVGSVDLPVIKVNLRPIIPGSSLKGAVRAEFTRVLLGLDTQRLRQLVGYAPAITPKDVVDRLENFSSSQVFSTIEESIKANLEGKDGNVGILDLLLGSNFFASPTLFTDAITTDSENLIRERNHVSIDQDKDSARKGQLLDLEAVNPGTRFSFRIIYNSLVYPMNANFVDRAFSLLVNFLDNREMLLGGWKSRGYGLVMFRKTSEIEFSPEKLVGVKS